MFLAIFSILSLLFGLFFGLAYPRTRFWNWVDAIYYPLAVSGVLLLYFEGELLRSISSIEERRAELAIQLREIEVTRPSADMYFSGKDLIRGGGKWLRLISEMDRICDGSGWSAPACRVTDALAPITAPAERLLLGYEGPGDIGGICYAAGEIFTRLSEDQRLSAFLMVPLAEHFFQGLEKGFFDTEFERVGAYIDELNPKLENEILEMIGYLSLNENEEALMKPIYEAEARYGWMVMNAFEVCLRAPKDIRSGKYAAWLENSISKQSEIDLREEELRDLRLSSRNVDPITKLRISYWPFVIVLALALKFAKGVAQIKRTRT